MIEYPLYRRVEISFKCLEKPVDIWTTDSEIYRIKTENLKNYSCIRLQSSPFSIIEFDYQALKKVDPTNEIRHYLSPTFGSFLQQAKIISNHSPAFSSRYVLSTILHYLDLNLIPNSVSISGFRDWDWIFLTSLNFIETITEIPLGVSGKTLIYAEHFLISNGLFKK